MGDVLTTLVQLAWVSALATASLEVVFQTRFYQINFGKGPEGMGNHTSRFFNTYELRPWLSVALGVFMAYQFGMMAISEGLGIDVADLLQLQGPVAIHADYILTGVAIGGGSKTIKAIAKNFSSTRKELTETLS